VRESLGSVNLASFKSSARSPNPNLNNSSPDFKKAKSSGRVVDSPEDELPDAAQYNEPRAYRIKSEIIRREPQIKGSLEGLGER